jgi:DNA (cytosine-5)-methyltransferase 1
MADGTLPLDFGQELVVDLFAGGGGASLGIARAYRDPDVAVNHNPVAIAVHTVNHPNTVHHTCDVFEIDPVQATGGRPVGVLWASPDCRHHSKAKGGKPRSKKIRGLAWVVVKWAAACLPRLIHLENVEEFADWGPLLADGSPCKVRKGMTFRRWVRQLERLGYRIEHRELVAADYGAPTIRKRLYVIARRDGRPIVWPKPSHSKTGAGGLPKWRTAAECIDFSLPANSIFGRKKPLADNTQRRVAKGLWRYVLNCAEPFIVPMRGTSAEHTSAHSIRDPLSTVTGQGTHHALVTPFLTEHANASTQRVFSADEPMRTQVAQIKGGHFALVAPTLIQAGHGEGSGKSRRRSHGIKDIETPLGTVVASGGGHAMVSAFLEQANGGFYEGDGRDLREPMSTVLQAGSQQRLVSAYLVKFYSCGGQWQGATEPMHTVPTKDRMGLVQSVHVPANTLAPELRARAKACADFLHHWLPEHFAEPADLVLLGDYALVDITLRMLVPRELARAQGFPDSYVLERGPDGKAITKTDQVRLIGNSVCPDVAEALIRANAADLIALYARAA